jgi:RAQPRD family integrative conjugative element protein
MEQTCRRTGRFTGGPRTLAVLQFALAVSLLTIRPAIAADDTLEREQLATLARQIELTHRLAEQTARIAPQERSRYHFDYPRLLADLMRVRAGLQDYLVPQRAQPRDPLPLAGQYTRGSAGNTREASSP